MKAEATQGCSLGLEILCRLDISVVRAAPSGLNYFVTGVKTGPGCLQCYGWKNIHQNLVVDQLVPQLTSHVIQDKKRIENLRKIAIAGTPKRKLEELRETAEPHGDHGETNERERKRTKPRVEVVGTSGKPASESEQTTTVLGLARNRSRSRSLPRSEFQPKELATHREPCRPGGSSPSPRTRSKALPPIPQYSPSRSPKSNIPTLTSDRPSLPAVVAPDGVDQEMDRVEKDKKGKKKWQDPYLVSDDDDLDDFSDTSSVKERKERNRSIRQANRNARNHGKMGRGQKPVQGRPTILPNRELHGKWMNFEVKTRGQVDELFNAATSFNDEYAFRWIMFLNTQLQLPKVSAGVRSDGVIELINRYPRTIPQHPMFKRMKASLSAYKKRPAKRYGPPEPTPSDPGPSTFPRHFNSIDP